MFRVGKSKKIQALAVAASLAAPAITMAQTSSTWTYTGAAPENFTNAQAWNPNTVPGASTAPGNGVADFPTYAGTPSGTNNIVMQTAVTLGGINFTGPFDPKFYSLNPVAGANPNSTITFSQTGGIIGSTVNVANGTATINAPVVGPSLFTKTGNGTLVLNGTNTFNTGVVVAGGVLRVSGSQGFQGVLTVGTGNGGALELLNTGTTSAVLTLGSASGSTLRNVAGNQTWSNNWFIAQTANVNTATGTRISVNGSIFDSNVNAITGFTKSGGGSLSINRAILNGTLGVTGGLLRIHQQATANLQTSITRVKGLTIAGGATPTATFDITNNIVIVDTPNTATGQASHDTYMAQILNANNGLAWDLPGITSSKAPVDLGNGVPTSVGILWNQLGDDTPLVYGDGGSLPLFHGQSVDQNSILIKYTYIGDADLNGVVDGTDFGFFTAGFDQAVPFSSWAFGDFDYNGVVDGTDFGYFSAGYDFAGPALGDPLVLQMAEFAEANGLTLLPSLAALVPEPGTLSLVGLATLGCLGRRRKR